MRTRNLHPKLNSALIVLVIGMFIYFKIKESKPMKIGIVKTAILFNEFNMTKDLSNIEKNKLKLKSEVLDSLYLEYQKLDEKKDKLKKKSLESILNTKSIELRQMQENYTASLSQRIWSRLNQYTSKYAIEHEYNLILGTNESGSILFSREPEDITRQILEYSNIKYEGKVYFNDKK